MTLEAFRQRLLNMGFKEHERPTTFAKVVWPESGEFVIVETGRSDGRVNCALYRRGSDDTPKEAADPFCGVLLAGAADPDHPWAGATCDEAMAFLRGVMA